MMNLLLGVILLGVTAESDFLPDAFEFKVEKAAREYRIQVYNTFRTDRPEFDRRATEGRRVYRVWKRNGRDSSDGEQVIQWFAQATEASRSDQVATLPPKPRFVSEQPSIVENEVDGDEIEDEWILDEQYAGAKNKSSGNGSSGASTETGSNVSQRIAETKSADSNPASSGILGRLGQTIFGSDRMGQRDNASLPAAGRDLAVTEPQRAKPLTDDVSVEEIKAQVDGFNASISAIRTSLSVDGPVETQTLADFVAELENLAERRRDLEPYLSLDVLSTIERRHIGSLVSPTQTHISIYQRIDDQLNRSQESEGDSAELSILLNDLRERVEALLADPSQI